MVENRKINVMVYILFIKKIDSVTDVFLFQWYSNDSYQFQCQHGQTECYGNIVQACAVNTYQDKNNILKYVTCLMTTVNISDVTNATYPVEQVSDHVCMLFHSEELITLAQYTKKEIVVSS
jgi:hypothetical protein